MKKCFEIFEIMDNHSFMQRQRFLVEKAARQKVEDWKGYYISKKYHTVYESRSTTVMENEINGAQVIIIFREVPCSDSYDPNNEE